MTPQTQTRLQARRVAACARYQAGHQQPPTRKQAQADHPEGKTCRIAIIDENGQVVAGGEDVTKAVFDVAIGAFQNLLKARGHLRTYSKPINASAAA